MYEILALRYAGPFVRQTPLMIWFKDRDQFVEVYYYIWCIRGQGETVVVDVGVAPDEAARRALAGYVSPADMLARVGVDAAQVRHVILTHLHWDHMGAWQQFPRARFYVQSEELRFWTEDPLSRRPPYRNLADEPGLAALAALAREGRVSRLDGEAEVLPGIVCIPAPGHSAGLQAVAVQTDRGVAIVGSDCGHLFRNYAEDWPSALIDNMQAWLHSYDRLRARVSSLDLLFPGHDAAMTTNFPAVADGVTRLV